MPLTMHGLFNYDRAILESQKGNWQKSESLLTNSLIENPDRADVLYDLGVSSFKTGHFDKALAYFRHAAEHTNTQQLKEQAFFNAGNTHVELKELQEAIEAYDQVLALNPDHSKAKHNKAVVQKMLEQQKKDEQKKDQKDKDQNKDNNSDKKDDQQKNNSPQQSKDDNKQDSQQDKSGDEKEKKQNKSQEENDGNQPHNQNKPEKNQEQKQQSNSDQKSDQKNETQQKKDSEQEQTQKTQPADTKKNENMPGGNEQKLTPSLARILQEHEKKDADLNKKMIKAMAGTQKGSAHGKNSW